MNPWPLLVAAAFVAAGCATDARVRDADRFALYRQHAGEPVSGFRYFGSINGWTPLGDAALAVWTRPNQAYLLTLSGGCPELDFAHAITLTHQFHTVSARFDRVIPLGHGPRVAIPCHIREIRPLDVAAIRAAQREMRTGVETAERAD